MTFRRLNSIVALLAVLWIRTLSAQEITPTPGTYELLEGKYMQFDARQKDAKISADRYDRIGLMMVLIAIVMSSIGFYVGSRPEVSRQVYETARSLEKINTAAIENYIDGKLAEPAVLKIDIKHNDYKKLEYFRERAFDQGLVADRGHCRRAAGRLAGQ